MAKIKVLLVDDQILFVESLKIVLATRTEDIEVMGIAKNGQEAIEFVDKQMPDVVLLDVRMPVMNGVEFTKIMCQKHLGLKVLILTTFDDDEYIVEALKHGARGYVKKDVPPTELIAAIRAIDEGGIIISPKVANKLMQLVNEPDKSSVEEKNMVNRLSSREKEVLSLLAEGLDNKEISEELYIAEQTVKNYVSNIYSKLDIYDRVQVALFVANTNLLGDESAQ